MMGDTEEQQDEVQRWTAKRRAALVLEILKGNTTTAEAARTHGLTVAECFELTVTVPPTTRATVRVPSAVLSGVTEGGRPLAGARVVQPMLTEIG